MQQQMAPSQVVQSTLADLNSALLRKHALEGELKALDEKVAALRNVLTGIELGKALQTEVLTEQARAAAAAKAEAPATP
jgi:hypothetical protein